MEECVRIFDVKFTLSTYKYFPKRDVGEGSAETELKLSATECNTLNIALDFGNSCLERHHSRVQT